MAELSGRLQRDVPLSRQCRFQLGGPADWLGAVESADELAAALEFARADGLRTLVYSGGSNLFFADAGFRGLVVRLTGGSWSLDSRILPPLAARTVERSSPDPSGRAGKHAGPTGDHAPTPTVNVSAGYDLPLLVRELGAQGLGGIEFLGNIPGSVGGAVAGNAGCYGRAIAEVLVDAEVYDIERRQAQTVDPDWLAFAYRHSRIKDDASFVVTAATLRLVPRPPHEVLGEVEAELESRLAKHPHFAACAGSFFKNPPGYPAWRVIADAGLEGSRVGGAYLHEKHANFLVNDGTATAADVLALARQVRVTVQQRLAIELEPEVRYCGPTGFEPIQ